MARVILLNGVSSSGKTTLAKAVQRACRFDLLRIGIDDYISMIPPGRETAPEWFAVESWLEDDIPHTRFDNGPLGASLMAAMRANIAKMAVRGFDMIVDEVCTANEIDEYRSLLSSSELLLVSVDASLDIIEQRERDRGDRQIGLARQQSRHLHKDVDYDLQIDTGTTSTDEAVRTITARFS